MGLLLRVDRLRAVVRGGGGEVGGGVLEVQEVELFGVDDGGGDFLLQRDRLLLPRIRRGFQAKKFRNSDLSVSPLS